MQSQPYVLLLVTLVLSLPLRASESAPAPSQATNPASPGPVHTSLPVRHLSVVSVPVADVTRAKAFYVGKLGFVVLADNDLGNGMRWVQLAPNAKAECSIALVTWFPAMKPGGVQGLVLDVPDLAGSRKAMIDKGIQVGDAQVMPWGTFANFTDPDGNGWMLHQP